MKCHLIITSSLQLMIIFNFQANSEPPDNFNNSRIDALDQQFAPQHSSILLRGAGGDGFQTLNIGLFVCLNPV